MEDLSTIHDPNRYYGLIRARVEDFLSDVEGKFYLSEVYDYAGAHDDNAKSAVRMSIQKLKKDRIIKSSDGRAGCYKKVENDLRIIDLTSIKDVASLDVALPLGFGHFVEIYAKDLIVYAGTPNQGKTSFMLEALRLNMNRFQCFYFSSEMSAVACRNRILKHRDTLLKEWKINFIESFVDVVDVIQPDAVNFVDYVEAPDGEFFRIPSILSQIQRKLLKGVAFVALQKNPGTSYGIGGYQTLAKPSIFFTLEYNVCKVEKAKNFKKINPNGFSAKFRIVDGINLSRFGDWTAP
jgi:hypothetical protein